MCAREAEDAYQQMGGVAGVDYTLRDLMAVATQIAAAQHATAGVSWTLGRGDPPGGEPQ